jgi:hypothetical protein
MRPQMFDPAAVARDGVDEGVVLAGQRLPNNTTARPRHVYRAAFHEAGHAVACLSLGHEFAEVLIYAEPVLCDGGLWISGQVRMAEPDALYPAIQLAAVSLAGPLAESRHSRRPLADVLAESGSQDLDDAVRVLARSQFNAFCAEDIARQRLRRHWRAVVRIADALIEHGAIDYAAALGIFRETRR